MLNFTFSAFFLRPVSDTGRLLINAFNTRPALKTKTAATLACVFLLASCVRSGEDKLHTLRGEIFGTYYSVKYVAGAETPAEAEVQTAILGRLQEIDAVMSTWNKDSELSQLNLAGAGVPTRVSEELAQILLLSIKLNLETEGAFDITVGPLVNLWGFGPAGELTRVPAEAEILEARKRTGTHHLDIDLPAMVLTKRVPLYLDLSAIAKGYAVDETGAVLEDMGVRDYLVEIGGEILARGYRPPRRGDDKGKQPQPWRIAIEAPVSGGKAIQRIVNMNNLGMATSGDYRNYYERNGTRYSHIIDPATGRPVRHTLASVSVAHPRTVIADAWATALLVLGEERGRAIAEREQIAAYFIRREGEGFAESWTSKWDFCI